MSLHTGLTIPHDDDADAFLVGVRNVVSYRGDVTIVRRDGTTMSGYVYDAAALDRPDRARLRMLPDDGSQRVTIALDDIERIEVTGRDTAAGKSFETYIRRYAEKLAAEHGVAVAGTETETEPETETTDARDDDACASS